MAQKLLTISLGTTSAKLAEVVKSGKKVQVYSAYNIPISEGLCDDGVILDVDSLAAELKQYMSKYKIRTKKVVFSIASKRVASKEAIIPFVKEKQIKSIVEINAADYFPVGNINDYAINYSIIETIKNAENTQYRLNVTATPNEMLENYTLLAGALKCSIEDIDYAGNAILQVLKYQTHSGEIDAILQLGYENTVINIMNGNVQVMQRTVGTGLNALISTVAESVGLDEEDAVAFLEDNDITRISSAYPDVKYIADSLISSIGRIFEFYNGRSAEHPIVGVRYIGDGTLINGIGDALSEGLGYTAEEIKILHNIQVKNKSVTPENATNFMSNIGAVIEPMHLKFVPVEEKEGAKEKDEKLPWRLVVISVVGSIALIGASTSMYYMAKSERDTLAAQLAAIEEVRTIEYQYLDAMSKKEAIEALYNLTKGSSDSLPTLIDDMEKGMPKGMSIASMNVNQNEVTFGAGGVGKASVAKMIMDMKDLSYVSDVRVDYISEDIEGIDPYDSYSMKFILHRIDEKNEEVVEETTTPENQLNENGGEE